MAILYLELEDEITTAVARVRAAGEPTVALVLPAGSRIASSRINFRLLAKEAGEHGTQLAIVSPEPTARSLASAAGLPTFSTVGRYESVMPAPGTTASPSAIAAPVEDAPIATERGPVQADFGLVRLDRTSGGPSEEGNAAVAEVGALAASGVGVAAAGPGAGGGAVTAPISEPVTEPVPRGPDPSSAPTVVGIPREWPPPGAGPRLPVTRGPRQYRLPRVGGAALIGAILLLVALGAGAVAAAYFLLPEARITVTPRVETFGPLVIQITADPDVTSPDAAKGVVPAAWQQTTVDAQDTFDATGIKVTEEKATGAVRFSNRDIGGAQSVPKGATVKTGSGIAFKTDKAVSVPAASVHQDSNGNLILVPGTASVAITASSAGTEGNVSAGTITVIPKGYNKNLLKVTNPNATSGGSHKETKVVKQSDYDAAVAALGDELQFEFDHWIGAGADAGSGALVVAESAELGDAVIDQPAGDLVGKAVQTFDLSGKADGRVVAVDPKALMKAGADRFLAVSVPAGRTLIGGAPSVTFKPIASTEPSHPRYEVSATGQGYRDVDAATIKRLVLGKPVDEARAMLGSYGDATVTLRPDWFGTIPQFEWRVQVDVSLPATAS